MTFYFQSEILKMLWQLLGLYQLHHSKIDDHLREHKRLSQFRKSHELRKYRQMELRFENYVMVICDDSLGFTFPEAMLRYCINKFFRIAI